MTQKNGKIPTVEWKDDHVVLIDQTKLPQETTFLEIRDEVAMWEAIKRLSVRGAPAIGVAAGYGLYIGVARRSLSDVEAFKKVYKEISDYLATSRPTAVNLFWALDACQKRQGQLDDSVPVSERLEVLLQTAKDIHQDDIERCQKIAEHGAALLGQNVNGILTHCNAGALATAGVGTAVGVITEYAKSKPITVYVDETRPLLQGARLTAWEMKQAGIDYRLISDNMAATMMKRGLVDAIVTGADRIAINGDSANKIGTMPLAICAKHFGIPFYIAAPLSTVDYNLEHGDDIPIEERQDEEITSLYGTAIAPEGTKTINPAFDVVPNELIAAIITEAGVIKAPYKEGLVAAKEKSSNKFDQ